MDLRYHPGEFAPMLLYHWRFIYVLVRGDDLRSCFGKPVVRGADNMPERANRIPPSKSWADEIDDLYNDATERSLKAIVATRVSRLVRDSEGPHDAEDFQRPVSLHG